MRKKDHSVAAATLAGVLGGLAGAWTMNQYSTVSSKVQKVLTSCHHQRSGNQQNQQQQNQDAQEDDATMKTADRIAVMVTDKHLTKGQKKKGGPIVHYAYGALLGGIYGALSELAPFVTKGAGTVYGTAVWVGGDEIGVPAMGLSKPPTEYPLSVHLHSLGSHLVYGATLDAVRKGVEAVL